MASLVKDIVHLTLDKWDTPVNIEIVYHKPSLSVTEPGRNPVVIFLPHWGGTARTYGLLQTHLAKHNPGITTIALSYPGTGNSSRDVKISNARDASLNSPINTLAEVVEDLISQLTDDQGLIGGRAEVVIVGHSMGGKIATSLLASTRPLPIAAMLLLAPAPPGALVLPLEQRRVQLAAYESSEQAESAIKHVLSRDNIPDNQLAELVEDAVNMTPEAKQSWLEYGMAEDIRPKLTGLKRKFKISVMVGREDQVETVERVQRNTVEVMCANGLDVEMTIVESCGHLITVEQVETLAKKIMLLVEEHSGR